MKKKLIAGLWLSILLLSVNSLNGQSVNASLQLIDGRSLIGKIASVSEAGEIAGAELPRGLQLETLLKISFDRPIKPVKFPVQIVLPGATADALARVGCVGVNVVDDQVRWNAANGDNFALSLQAVRAIVWSASPVVSNAIRQPFPDADQVVVAIDGVERLLSGIVEAVNEDAVRLNYKGKSRTIGLEKVSAIVVADAGAKQPTGTIATVRLIDGSVWAGAVGSWGEGRLTLSIVEGTTAEIDTSQISSVEVQNDGLAYLSDMTPTDVREKTDFTVQRSYQNDKSITGKPLRISGADGQSVIEFRKGIGTQSTSELTYASSKKFNRFRATIGIDVEANGRGDCEVVVLGDGIELFRTRIQAADAPQEVDVEIGDINEVTLGVYPGQEFDLADHLDWCDARFLKTK